MELEEPGPRILFYTTGLERSGTIYITRLMADALNVQSGTRGAELDDYTRDPVVWGLDRQSLMIRRVHWFPDEYTKTLPVLLIVRDPRDTAVSQAHFYKKTDFNSHALWVAPQWNKFYREWLKDDRVRSVARYRDMVDDPRKEIYRIAKEMGVRDILEEENVEKAVNDNSFDNMVNYLKRKGGYGGWREILSDSTARTVRSRCLGIMQRLGYDE